MEVRFHNNKTIAEIVTDAVVITNGQDAIELIYNPLIAGADRVILHQRNLTEGFFTLSTGIAGDILQKFVNYRCRLAIVGSFSTVSSNSLADFIRESNKGKSIFFADDLAAAIQALGN